MHLIRFVEIFGGKEAMQRRAMAFYASMGRAAVRLGREAVGHSANRFASALWRQAVNIAAEGIANVEPVDMAFINGPGLRWSVVGAQ